MSPLMDPGNFCSVGSVDHGRRYFLRVRVVGSCDDLNANGHVGGEIHFVLVPDHFIQSKRIAAVILPAYPEAYYSFECLA